MRSNSGFVALVLGLAACSCSRPARPAATAARVTTALAAVFEAAAAVADPETLATFHRFGIAPAASAELDSAFPERVALRDAVARWPDTRKQAALAWVGANAAWTSQLHALALESFTDTLEPRTWGPTMSRFDPGIFSRRAGLAPLLREALADPAVRGVAERLASPGEDFTAAAVREHRQRLLRYLRLPDDLPPFAAFHAPLMAAGNGVNAELPDGTVLFVVGPSPDPAGPSMVLDHEMAHQPVFRLLGRPAVAAALAASRCAFQPITVRSGYDSWPSYFAEALVRSLSYRLQGMDALDTGFVFERELTEDLRRWETSDRTFEVAVVGMLEGVRERHCGP